MSTDAYLLPEGDAAQPIATVIRSIIHQTPFETPGCEITSRQTTPEGEVVTGEVYNEGGDFLASFIYRHSWTSQELTYTSWDNQITFGHEEDDVSVKDYAHRGDDPLYRNQRLSARATGATYTCSFMTSTGDCVDGPDIFRDAEGLYHYNLHSEGVYDGQMDQDDIDRSFGSRCPFHSSKNVEQFLADNTAFLKGESDIFHEEF